MLKNLSNCQVHVDYDSHISIQPVHTSCPQSLSSLSCLNILKRRKLQKGSVSGSDAFGAQPSATKRTSRAAAKSREEDGQDVWCFIGRNVSRWGFSSVLGKTTMMDLLPWPKKLKQARKPNIGACMLDRSRACATCARLSQFFWPG